MSSVWSLLSEALCKINELNESNIIEKIKDGLGIHPSIYQEWEGNSFDINHGFDSGFTLLTVAAGDELTAIAKLLIGKGANVNAKRNDGSTPLHYAARNGCMEIVEALLEKGADVNALGKDDLVPLHYAAMKGETETVKALLKNGANIDAVDKNKIVPLHYAAQNGHTETVEVLLEEGANVNAMEEGGWIPLHCAVRHCRIEIVKKLLEKGATVNAADRDGKAPLHLAADRNHIEIVKLLINNGANVNTVDKCERTPLYWAALEGNEKIVKSLLAKKADPLLGSKSVKMLKPLVELMKNGSLKPAKQGQVDDEYDLIKYSLLLRSDSPFIDVVERGTFDKLIHPWFSETSDLTEEQKKLSKELLSMLKDIPYLARNEHESQMKALGDFLRKNANNGDLKRVLNLQRGEFKLTILHIMSSLDWYEAGECVNSLVKAGADPNICDDTGKTPLHYAARFGCSTFISFLLSKGDLNVPDKKGKTPLDIAIENHNYHVEVCFLTGEQQDLMEKLYNNITDPNKLQELLSEHKNNQDLKKCLVLRDREGKSQILQHARNVLCNNGTLCKRIESLLLEAGAIDYKGLDGEEDVPKSDIIWGNLISYQKELLKEYLDKVNKAQSMRELQQFVNEAIANGVRFNFLHQGSLYGAIYESKYSFMDCVVKRIKEMSESKSEKNPEVASKIICTLVSRGAVSYSLNSIVVIDKLESELKDHKDNMKKAYSDYVSRTREFAKVARSAATGEVKDAKCDNTTIYLEYSGNSAVRPAKITKGVRDLGLMQEKTGYSRSIIKIGKDEVEVIECEGNRHYTDLADGSDIALIFSTSLGELEVRLYPDKLNKERVIVEVRDQEKLKKLKDSNEEIGKKCFLGELSVYDAIKQGYFEKPKNLHKLSDQLSEKIMLPKQVLVEISKAVEGLNSGDMVKFAQSNRFFQGGSGGRGV
ncbi:ankyrin repeat domain-containing protein [Wolbachia endosymbiont of Ctenocephalides felis wCfeJ]|uniref:ankyrin repeat domain-containing protein n=1 Tax=Wolbachia endosymbiont of Ctenocephalides felis wCfeJ TaxID=2732594 RepID=UPI00144702EE|nr:ankyrin repeat domain-containing protein [Wolbachia endosymbiont of Ctenocephalides felis wCfeJ]WCR58311.1 MAG: Actin-binding protein [Wolbachia endosymbiont of Ctenocephalides felis wCfeJ]